MLIVFEQIIIFLFFGIVGYVLCKSGLVDSKHSKLLSSLIVYVFLPCMTFKTFAGNLHLDYLKQNYMILVVSAILFLVLIEIMWFLSKYFAEYWYERSVFFYSLLISNYGNIGYPFIEKLYGAQVLLDMMVFTIPFLVFSNSVAFCLLTKTSLKFKKMFRQPVIIAMAVGLVFGVLQIPLPDTVITILESGSNCMAPVAMLLTGMIISEYNLKELLSDKKAYIVVAFRLIIIPSVLVIILKLIGLDNMVLITLVAYGVPCGSNAIVLPRLVNENCKIGASLAFISTLLCSLTIPLLVHIFT